MKHYWTSNRKFVEYFKLNYLGNLIRLEQDKTIKCLFHKFPEDMCNMIFNNYTVMDPHNIIQSIYTSMITSILLGTTDPENVFSLQPFCKADMCRITNAYDRDCCYSYILEESSDLPLLLYFTNLARMSGSRFLHILQTLKG